MSDAPVAVCTVTYNAAPDIGAYLDGIERLDPQPRELVVVDCASQDGTVARLRSAGERSASTLEIEALEENLGFAGGMNRALERTTAPWILCLNADARPAPDYLAQLLAAAETDSRVGAVTGRLTRPPDGPSPGRPGRPGADVTLDACGMVLSWSWRHFDRGSEKVDHGQYLHAAEVFGATGAASLFRRTALEDVALEGQVFDESFHSFREDAELAFRFHERNWRVLYTPEARCVHRRSNTPGRRAKMTPTVNMHTLKNRYLLRAYHQSAMNFVLTLPATATRDLGILGYVLARERSSLEAYRWLWRHRSEIRRRRKLLRERRTADRFAIERWFLTSERPI